MLKVMKKKLLVVITMLVVASGFIFTGSTSTKAKDNDVKYLGKYKLKIKLGSKVQINGKTYVAEDVGGGVKGKHIDVFFKSHKQTKRFGKKTGVKVYKVN